MNKIEIPPSPFERIDYVRELELARFSRVAYLDKADISNSDPTVNPDHKHLFDRSLGAQRWDHIETRNFNDTTGLVAHAFVQERPDRRIVLAIRGSDALNDWTGPNFAVARDGELLDMVNLPAPVTATPKRQMAAIQEAGLPGKAWHPQFRQALDFAAQIRDTYEAQGYRIEVAGHSGGGAHSQVISHTFGWHGRSFDAPGAANIVASAGYRDWLDSNGITAAGTPRFRPDPFDSGFLNYKVNNSVVSYKTGPHLGDAQTISSLVGREGLASRARWAAGILGGAVSETPLAGPVLKTFGRPASMIIRAAAHGGQHGVDALDRHDMNRIVQTFEDAVSTGKLKTIGGHGDRQWPHIAQPASPDSPSLARRDDALRAPPSDAGARRFFDHLHAAMKTGDALVFERALGAVADRDEARERHAMVVAQVDAREQARDQATLAESQNAAQHDDNARTQQAAALVR